MRLLTVDEGGLRKSVRTIIELLLSNRPGSHFRNSVKIEKKKSFSTKLNNKKRIKVISQN